MSRQGRRFWVRAFVFGLSVTLCVVRGAARVRAAETGARPEPAVRYAVRFEGVADGLLHLVQSVSRLVTFENRPPPTLAGLERRADEDMDQINDVLRSEGYYEGRIRYRIARDQRPVQVTVTIQPGPEYLLTKFDVRYVTAEKRERPAPEGVEIARVPLDVRARAPVIVADEARVVASLARQGYPYAEAVDRKVIVDHRTRAVRVTVDVAPGPLGRFGKLTVHGLVSVDEAYVRRRVPWKPDAVYDANLLDKLRAALLAGGLFRSVSIEKAPHPTEDGRVPIEVDVVERKHRSIGGSVGYSTSEQFGGTLFWENRNLRGSGERLHIAGEAAEIRQGLTGDFQIPAFRRLDQNLDVHASALREDTDAYRSLGTSGLVALDRGLAPHLRGSAGVSAEVTDITDVTGKRLFSLLGSPLTLRYDTRDNVLDAKRGVRAALGVTPYVSFDSGRDFFMVSEFNGSVYVPIYSDRFVLALRTRLGSIVGPKTTLIPASKRFFAGGGGSIRGYKYQLVGPLDAEGNPIGGRSVAEFGAELRTRITEKIGIVPFIEGGNVFESTYPDFSRKLRWGAGLGLRYHTVAGPLRIDFAFPLNRRAGIDNAFEFYISIGQAF